MNNQTAVRLPSKLLELHQVIAASLWYTGPVTRSMETCIKSLASHWEISEEDVRAAMDTPEYVEAVANLMLSTRSPAKIVEWIKNYPNMPSVFGKRMGLSEDVAEELIEEILDRLCNG